MRIVKGRQSVLSALESAARIDRIIIDRRLAKSNDIAPIIAGAQSRRIRVEWMTSSAFTHLAGENSQGVLAYLTLTNQLRLDDICSAAQDYPIVVAVDHIEDPFNFGGILRSAESLGASAVIYPKDRNVQLTPGVMKVASGAAHLIPLIKVTNLGTAFTALKQSGYWIYGSDMNAKSIPISQFEPNFPLVIILGNEHAGVSHGIRKWMDESVSIEMRGQTPSLNVSVAAGILIYHVVSKWNHGR